MANANSFKLVISLDPDTEALLRDLVAAVQGVKLPNEKTVTPIQTAETVTAPAAVIPAATAPASAAQIIPTALPIPAPTHAPTIAAPIAPPAAPVFQIPGMATNVPTQIPVQPPVTAVAGQPTAVPTGEPQYTVEQLMRAGADLMNAGKNPGALFQQFGIQNMMQLPKEQYGAFATALRQMGAKL